MGLGQNLLGSIATLDFLRRGLNAVNDSFQVFAADEAISRRVAFALQQVKSNVPFAEFDKLADALSLATGYDDDLIRSQVEVLSRFRLTGDEIRTLLPLIVDVAAREGKEVDDVTRAVGLGIEGQGRGLKLLGIQFKATNNEAHNYLEILKQLRPFQGAAAQAADSPAGVLRRQQTELENLQHAIGQRFDPEFRNLLAGRNLLLRGATGSVERGAFGRAIDFLLTPLREARESGIAARRGDTVAGRAFRQLFPPPTGATEAALGGGADSTAARLGEIANNTAATEKNTRRPLFRGAGAGDGLSIRELNQALGVR